MKRVVLFVLVATLSAGLAGAAQLATDPNPATESTGGPYNPELPNITQNSDPNNVVAGSVACVSGGISSDNHFLRRYFLNLDHGINLQYNVTSVDVGIESVNVYIGTGAPVTVNVYSINNGAAFTFANMSMLGSTTRSFPDGTALVIENFVVAGSILDPAAQDLVIDLYNANVVDTGDFGYWPGSNSAGETRPSYIASDGCGLTEPATLQSIGFGTMHLVQTVNGDEAVVPTPTPNLNVQNPVPAMSRFGVIAMVVLLLGVAVLVLSRRH